MKKLHLVPKGAFPIHPDADLATIRSRLQRWIDSSHSGSYLGLKPFTRRGFEHYQDPGHVNPTSKDISFLKEILNARFSIRAWIRQYTPTKFWFISTTHFSKYELTNKFNEILSYKGLGARVIEEKDFYFFKILNVSITPVEVWLDMQEFKLSNLQPCVLKRSVNNSSKGYSVRTYIPVFNERTGLVYMGEKNTRRQGINEKGFLVD